MPHIEVVFHGSPYKLETIEPRNKHGDLQVGNVVFASLSRSYALAFAGRLWSDRDFQLGTLMQDGTRKIVMREMRPGAKEEVFRDASGYVYYLPEEGFQRLGRKGALWERVNTQAVVPVQTEAIKNVLDALERDSNFSFEFYNPRHPATRAGISRIINRMKEMSDKGKEYKKWRLKNAPPEIVSLFEEMERVKSY